MTECVAEEAPPAFPQTPFPQTPCIMVLDVLLAE